MRLEDKKEEPGAEHVRERVCKYKDPEVEMYL